MLATPAQAQILTMHPLFKQEIDETHQDRQKWLCTGWWPGALYNTVGLLCEPPEDRMCRPLPWHSLDALQSHRLSTVLLSVEALLTGSWKPYTITLTI